MVLDILIIVILTSVIQSVFGVGVLLFGTPLLLLRGYSFVHAVIILLPISVAINLIQIAKDHRSADMEFYKKILIYSTPFVVIFLFVVTKLQINLGIVIGLFLLFVAAKDYSLRVGNALNFLVRYEKLYFILMGTIHGLTNLGGSLLTAIVHSKGYEKQITRVTVALSYATFAVFQIVTLWLSGYSIDVGLSVLSVYLVAGVVVFILTEKLIYMEINNERYSRYFSVFLLLSGVLLCVNSV